MKKHTTSPLKKILNISCLIKYHCSFSTKCCYHGETDGTLCAYPLFNKPFLSNLFKLFANVPYNSQKRFLFFYFQSSWFRIPPESTVSSRSLNLNSSSVGKDFPSIATSPIIHGLTEDLYID